MITKGKTAKIASRRLASSRLGSGGVSATKKLFDEIAPKYKDREGGYTRVVKMIRRGGDGSSMAIIELV